MFVLGLMLFFSIIVGVGMSLSKREYDMAKKDNSGDEIMKQNDDDGKCINALCTIKRYKL